MQKLCSAVKHAIWDLVTEYKFLPNPLTEPFATDAAEMFVKSGEAQTPVTVETLQEVASNLDMNQFETGEEGKLHDIYCIKLFQWFRFALEIGVPSVKKHEVHINYRHSISTIIRELETLIQCQAPDTSSRAFVLKDKQPFIEKFLSNPDITQSIEHNTSSLENEDSHNLPHYVPCDFTKDEQETYTECILIARNFNQWKSSFNKGVQPEIQVAKGKTLISII